MTNNTLPHPFDKAFERGDNIDYRCKGTDNEYVKNLGYTVHMGSDCSCYAPGFKGFSLSSYGDWGSVFVDDFDEKSEEIFFDMYSKGIIQLWRITAYIKDEHGNVIHYTYDENGWEKHDENLGWISCPAPY